MEHRAKKISEKMRTGNSLTQKGCKNPGCSPNSECLLNNRPLVLGTKNYQDTEKTRQCEKAYACNG